MQKNNNLSTIDNEYTYTGRRLDPSGLMYFRARYYSPQLGQFISRDPLGYVDGMSQYRGYFAPDAVDPWGLMTPKDDRVLIGYIYHFESNKTTYLGLTQNLNERGFETHKGITGDRGLGLGNGWRERGANVTVYNVYANDPCTDRALALEMAERDFGDHHGIKKVNGKWTDSQGRIVRNKITFMTDERYNEAKAHNFGTTKPTQAKGFTFKGRNAAKRLNAYNSLVPLSRKNQSKVLALPLTGPASKLFSGVTAIGLVSTFQDTAKAQNCCHLIDHYNNVAKYGTPTAKLAFTIELNTMLKLEGTVGGNTAIYNADNIPQLSPIANPFNEFRGNPNLDH